MFSILPLRILYFPCYVEVSLDSKLERNKKNFPKTFQSMLSRMDKLDLFLNTNVLLFDVLTILRYSLVSSVKKINFMSKSKTRLNQTA